MSESEGLAIIGYFEREQMEKNQTAKRRNIPCSDRRNVYWHIFLCRSLVMIQVNQSWVRPNSFILRFRWSLLMNQLFILFTLTILPTTESEQCKPASALFTVDNSWKWSKGIWISK